MNIRVIKRCSSDEGRAYVRLLKQKVVVPSIEVENIETNTIAEEQTEYVENDTNITNVSEDEIETEKII